MERVPEPELMDDPAQALAYHQADFSEAHSQRVALFHNAFPGLAIDGPALDIGCGSGDVLFRFARAFPKARFLGVDGAGAMLALAREIRDADPDLRDRVAFLEGVVPQVEIPPQPWRLLMSHSLLHHLRQPGALWDLFATIAPPCAAVFVADLRRPGSIDTAREIVQRLAGNEPQILQRDFFHSLCAAYTAQEVRNQLAAAGLPGLAVDEVGENHLVVHGWLPGGLM